MKKIIHLIAAARPNFMKIAPLYHALKKEPWAEPIIVHTGQHYDQNMSHSFFHDFNLPDPDIHLGIGSGTHAEQTGRVMIAYEKVLLDTKPDLVVVVGDVNSTMATTLAASKLGVKVAHLEAGLRSFDRSMPEEINRLVTDSLADILWTPSPDADENLIKEGVPKGKITRVGNIMIDSLELLRQHIEGQTTYTQYGLKPKSYGVVTLHRPSNVDNPGYLKSICKALSDISAQNPLIFPAHPRTRECLSQNEYNESILKNPDIILVDPISYIPFMNLIFNCKFVITDSGGIQEETTYLKIPCITLRNNTERPITIEQGTNCLCKPENLVAEVKNSLDGQGKTGSIPNLWDGNTAHRVAQSIRSFLANTQHH